MKEWRRKYTRIRCFKPPVTVIPLHLHFDTGKDGWGIIQDISLGGIGIETRTNVKTGQTVYATFTLAESFSFTNAKALVRRAVSDGQYITAGIEFESLLDRKHLEEALAALTEQEGQKEKQP